MSEQLNFRCCFCGNKIQPNKVDPMNINIVANYGELSENSPSQDFYSHFNCFKERLRQDLSGYFLESNFIIDKE